MEVDEDQDQPSIESVPRNGFRPRFEKRGRHLFCGAHKIAGAGCPNCDRPLMRMMSLDASDERLGLAALRLSRVPLLFCWQCNIAQDVTQYRLRSDGGIELLRFKRGTQGPDFPYSDYPVFFPEARFELRAVPQAPAGSARHQVGGRPFVLQGLRDIRCKVCRRKMRFLASIADNATGKRTFAGNSGVQTLFHLCLEDGVVASYHECD
ncbi:MAG: hypothetical protein H6838_15215 [Planctomycetes bacterium]|nr:hypothetical protein [Planctomycetota bacterium]